MAEKSTRGRGILVRVVKRAAIAGTRRLRLSLTCGHEVERSAGQYSERSYCPSCTARARANVTPEPDAHEPGDLPGDVDTKDPEVP